MVNREFVQIIKKEEVKIALKKLGLKREVRPDDNPIEVWKFYGEKKGQMVTNSFQQRFRKVIRCYESREKVLSSPCTKTRVMYDCANY